MTLAGRVGALIGAVSLGVSVHGAALAQIPVLREPVPDGQAAPAEPAAPPAPPKDAPLPPAPAAPSAVAAPKNSAPPAAAPGPESPVVPPGYVLMPIADARRAALPYEDGEPIPAGYQVRQEIRRGPVIAGAIVMGVPWTFSVIGASAADFEDMSGFLLLPGVGPWLMLLAGGANDVDCGLRDDFCARDRSGLRGVLLLDGMVQSAGAVMLTIGLLYPRGYLVPNVVGVSIVPTQVGPHGYGLGAVGTF
ncbi:MAG: hypothetical protein ABUL60_13745 [Myxococcales bacterium]